MPSYTRLQRLPDAHHYVRREERPEIYEPEPVYQIRLSHVFVAVLLLAFLAFLIR